jgi:hypothetical protein
MIGWTPALDLARLLATDEPGALRLSPLARKRLVGQLPSEAERS